MNVMLSAFP